MIDSNDVISIELKKSEHWCRWSSKLKTENTSDVTIDPNDAISMDHYRNDAILMDLRSEHYAYPIGSTEFVTTYLYNSSINSNYDRRLKSSQK